MTTFSNQDGCWSGGGGPLLLLRLGAACYWTLSFLSLLLVTYRTGNVWEGAGASYWLKGRKPVRNRRAGAHSECFRTEVGLSSTTYRIQSWQQVAYCSILGAVVGRTLCVWWCLSQVWVDVGKAEKAGRVGKEKPIFSKENSAMGFWGAVSKSCLLAVSCVGF